MSLAELKKYKVAWGVYIGEEQASSVNFQPDENWQEVAVDFGDESKPGFLTTHLNCVIVHRAALEVKKFNGNRWEYAGLYWDKTANWQTKLSDMSQDEKKKYNQVTRLLVIFLDKKKNPLHSGVLQLTLKNACAKALGSQITQYYKDFEQAFYAQYKAPAKTINAEGKSKIIVDIELGLHRHETNNPTIYGANVACPTIPVGTTKDFTNTYGRPIKYIGRDVNDLIISINEPFGKSIISYHKEYVDFAKPNKGYTDQQTETPKPAATEPTSVFDLDDNAIPF